MNHNLTGGRKAPIFFLSLLLLLSATSLAHADPPALNTTTYISMLPSAKLSNLMLDNTGRYNGSIMAGASYINRSEGNALFYSLNLTTGGSNLRVNLTSTNTLQFGENATSSNTTIFAWMKEYACPTSSVNTLKYGAGTPNMIWQLSSACVFRYELINSTGTSSFPSSGLTPEWNKWTLYALASDSAFTFRPYTCTYGGNVRAGSTTTVTGSKLRSSSQDAIIIGSDGGSLSVNETAGWGQANRTLSSDDLQLLCDLGPNFEQDNITATLDITASNGYMNSTFGNNVPAWTGANNSSGNTFTPQADCTGAGNENCFVTIANGNLARAIISNMTGSNGNSRNDLDGSSLRNSSGGLKPCSSSDFGSICMLQSTRYNNAQRNIVTKITLTQTDPDLQTANYCTANSRGYPSNTTEWGRRRAEELDLIGCDEPMANGLASCEVEIWNEPDLAQFYCSNVSTRTDPILTAGMINITDAARTAIMNYTNASNSTSTANIRALRMWAYPTANVNTTDAVYWSKAKMGNITSRSWTNIEPNAFHLYACDYWNNGCDLYEAVASAVVTENALCLAAGISAARCNVYGSSEWDTGNATLQNAAAGTTQYLLNQVSIARFRMYWLLNPQLKNDDSHYSTTDWSNLTNASTTGACSYPRMHCAFIHPQVTSPSTVLQAAYKPLSLTAQYNGPGNRYNATPNSSTVLCTSGLAGTSYTLTCVNSGYNSVNVTYTILGSVPVKSVTNVETGTSFTVSGGTFTLTDITALDVNAYNLDLGGIAFNVTSPAQNVSIAEPNNQTFSYTLLNATGVSLNSVWTLNGTTVATNVASYQFPGNYSSQGNWIVNVTVNSTTNTITYQWNLTVNNTNRNITFTTSPAQNTTFAEPNSQTFTITLTNPDSLPYNTTWRLSGAVQTVCANATSCTFNGNYSSNGSYTMNVTLTSSMNNPSYQWGFTVTDATPATCTVLDNGQGLLWNMTLILLVALAAIALLFYLMTAALGIDSIVSGLAIGMAMLILLATFIGPMVGQICR